jgi:hypothetical protein
MGKGESLFPPELPQFCLLFVFGVIPQNPDCALKAYGGSAVAVGRPLESNPDSRTDSPSLHDDALQQAKTRSIRPALNEGRERAVTRKDFIDRPELSNAAVGTCFSIKHFSGKGAGGVTARNACKENDVLTGIGGRERWDWWSRLAGSPLREGDFEALMVFRLSLRSGCRDG